jgi:hypothetical protein
MFVGLAAVVTVQVGAKLRVDPPPVMVKAGMEAPVEKLPDAVIPYQIIALPLASVVTLILVEKLELEVPIFPGGLECEIVKVIFGSNPVKVTSAEYT